MRYPNLRYGNPTELAYYAMGMAIPDLARLLRRDERTVRDWLSQRAKVPWWVPEMLRLKRMEMLDRQRQMFGAIEQRQNYTRLGVVQPDNVLTLAQPQLKPHDAPLHRQDPTADADAAGQHATTCR